MCMVTSSFPRVSDTVFVTHRTSPSGTVPADPLSVTLEPRPTGSGLAQSAVGRMSQGILLWDAYTGGAGSY